MKEEKYTIEDELGCFYDEVSVFDFLEELETLIKNNSQCSNLILRVVQEYDVSRLALVGTRPMNSKEVEFEKTLKAAREEREREQYLILKQKFENT